MLMVNGKIEKLNVHFELTTAKNRYKILAVVFTEC